MLQNEYILSEIGLDTAEHEQLQNRAEFVHILCKFLRKPAAGFATVPSISAQGTAAGSGPNVLWSVPVTSPNALRTQSDTEDHLSTWRSDGEAKKDCATVR